MKKGYYALAVFLGGCSYGILSTFVKLAYAAGFSLTEVSGGQYFFGTVIIWGAVLFTKNNKISLKEAFILLLCGIPFALTGLFYYQSLKTLNASMAIVFLFQFVWIGTLFDWIFYKKKPTKGKLLSIVILLIGSFLAANITTQQGVALSWQGVIWGLLSSLTYTLSLFLSSIVGKNTTPLLKSALFSTGAFIVIIVLLRPTFLFNFSVLMGMAPYGLILGIFEVVLPPLLFLIGMPHVGPGLGTILPASELPVAIIMSLVVLKEQVNWLQWVGVILILAGIIGSNIRLDKEKADEVKDCSNVTF